MKIPKFIETVSTQMMRGKVSKLEEQVHKLQAMRVDDILSVQERLKKYKGNRFTNYDEAVVEIGNKYSGTADWGVLQTGNIIDLRAAFIINEGPKIIKKTEDADAEYEWAQKFFEYNDIDKEVAQEFAKEAEIEGKIALKLDMEDIKEKNKDGKEIDTKAVTVRFVSWADKKYTITTDPQDNMKYKEMTWKPKGGTEEEKLEEKEFVYKKFGGRINKPNEAAPKVMKCLTQIEDLDKALRDWREINRIFAAPILTIKCENKEDVANAHAALEHKNWKIKKIFISTGEMTYVIFDIKGIESLEKEIITLAKMISGTTGVTVQYLGLADLLKNRSTSEDLREMLVSTTMKERQTWKGAYEEIIRKAMNMFNEEVNAGMSNAKKLDPDKIGIDIPVVTKEQWEHLEKVLLPACMAGKISDEYFQEKIPGLDMEIEQKRKEDKEASDLQRVLKENEDLKAEKKEQELFGRGKEDAVSVR